MTMPFDPIVDDPRVQRVANAQPHPLAFMTISGAHLYGFASPDSDVDLRGAHILPLRNVLGFRTRGETIESGDIIEGLEVDLVTHDLRKFAGMMLRKNGYVLEQLYSPLVVRTSPLHDALKRLGGGSITKSHVHHYKGFAINQRKLFDKDRPRRIKPLLYAYRVLLTGIHLMRTGEVEANLIALTAAAPNSAITDLIARKAESHEHVALADNEEIAYHTEMFDMLLAQLERAAEESTLPITPSRECAAAIEQLVIDARLGYDESE